ncbi:MAG: hypothetical protein JO194_03075 [Candidatus Eremiobacteraeota bacterium]|nr:hypothetical protein [Candidatus Eremiobacteraeota bacterium]
MPVYPGSRPADSAREQTARAVVGSTDTLTVMMTTRDRFDDVKRFYEDALPKGKREVTLPMGKLSNCTMQFYEKNAQKQVTLLTINGMTVIELASTAIGPLVPAASPSG